MNREQLTVVLADLGLMSGKLKVSGNNISIQCPLAKWRHKSGTDGHPSMNILTTDGTSIVHCFGCNFKGPLSWLVYELWRLTGDDKYYGIAKLVEEQDKETYSWGDYDSYTQEPKEPVAVCSDDHEEQVLIWRKIHHKYMDIRKLGPITCLVWEIGFDYGRHALTLPVRSRKGNLLGVVGRLTDADFKYYNYWGFKRGQAVLGANLVRHDTTCIVVEGALDAPRVWQYLYTHSLLSDFSVVATMGSQVTMNQVDRISELADRFILLFDNDDAGRIAQAGVHRLLKRRACVLSVEWPQEAPKDPDEVVSSDSFDLQTLLSNAKFYF